MSKNMSLSIWAMRYSKGNFHTMSLTLVSLNRGWDREILARVLILFDSIFSTVTVNMHFWNFKNWASFKKKHERINVSRFVLSYQNNYKSEQNIWDNVFRSWMTIFERLQSSKEKKIWGETYFCLNFLWHLKLEPWQSIWHLINWGSQRWELKFEDVAGIVDRGLKRREMLEVWEIGPKYLNGSFSGKLVKT